MLFNVYLNDKFCQLADCGFFGWQGLVNPNESGGYPGEAPKNRISGGEPLISQGATVAGENLAYRAFALVYERLGQAVPAVTLTLELEVPLARGLGSSATAIVAGLRAAHYFLGEPLPAS